MLDNPCKPDCAERNATCHCKGNCAKYDAYKEEYDKWKAEYDKQRKYDADFYAYRKETSNKIKRNRHNVSKVLKQTMR